MGSIRLVVIAAVLASAASGAVAKSKEVSLRDEEQAACYDDAQRLCADTLPDVDKTIACMKPKKAQVSAKCAAFYK